MLEWPLNTWTHTHVSTWIVRFRALKYTFVCIVFPFIGNFIFLSTQSVHRIFILTKLKSKMVTCVCIYSHFRRNFITILGIGVCMSVCSNVLIKYKWFILKYGFIFIYCVYMTRFVCPRMRLCCSSCYWTKHQNSLILFLLVLLANARTKRRWNYYCILLLLSSSSSTPLSG